MLQNITSKAIQEVMLFLITDSNNFSFKLKLQQTECVNENLASKEKVVVREGVSMRRKMESGLRRVSYRRYGGASLRSERKVAEICMRMKEKLGKQSR